VTQRKRASAARGRSRRGSEARRADRYRLYEESVQDPELDVALFRRIFSKRFGRPPRLLREDFCGTAALACGWVASHGENRAWGIDLDPEPLAWGREHNLSALSWEQQKRVELIQGDVLEVEQLEKVDITVAYNFSYFTFQTRPLLLRYLRQVRSTLAEEGLLMLDAYGGADAQKTMTETREQDGFDYVWDQDLFDPINHRAVNYIHFEFADGSQLRKAFAYDWRLWSLPELRDLLIEAGFSEVEVYWEGTESRTGEGNGIYRKATRALDDPAWVAYLVGVC
jgi:hypothetical protein